MRDYSPVSARLSFPSGETNKSFDLFIHNDQVFTGDRTFWIALTDATGGGQLAYPARAAITIVEGDRFGATESVTTNQLPDFLPTADPTGALQVYLEPAAAQGQWRLAGELFWRTSGELVSGLIVDNYIIEFKSVTNYYDLANLQVPVIAGPARQVTNAYTAQSVFEAGQLTVVINPPSVATGGNIDLRGQWRLLGEINWHDSSRTISNLNAGGLTVEFKNITNFAKPFDLEVTVLGGVNNRVKAEYAVKTASGGLIPRVLNFSEVTDTNWPYLYSGQLQTDAGLSSGVVVKERVVLTAAHALFNDNTFEWVTDARWFFQKHLGDYLPVPQRPRGWYVIGSYSVQRTNDQPGFSTLESKQSDAAALYFTETDYDANKPGRGGYGGYLFSDAGAYNEHLMNAQDKFLVGYPLIPGAETNWGKLYATVPANLHFVSLTPKVFRTTEVLSYPGNSGGPLYVQWTNGMYYPAGIYLGEASQTLLRAIDGEVVDLINRAEASGNGGGNFTGGGVITISPLYTAATFASGYVQVRLGPPAAVAAGGAWRVAARNIDYTTNSNERIPLVGGGSFLIEFRPVPGWLLPTNQIVGVAADQETILDAYYIDAQPSLIYRLEEGMSRLSVSGASGASYRVEFATSLTTPVDWTPLTTFALVNSPFTVSNTLPATDASGFYRAVLVP